MSYRTIQVYNLMEYEFSQVEGDFTSLRESDLRPEIWSGMSFQAFLEQLRTGHQVLLTNVPSIPLIIRDRDEWGNQYWRVNPAVESNFDSLAHKAYTSRMELVNYGIGSSYSGSINASVYTEPYIEREPVKLTLAERIQKQRQERFRELDSQPETMPRISASFAQPALKPKPPQVFAKSSLVPCGTCDIGTEKETLSSVGQVAAYGGMVMKSSVAETAGATSGEIVLGEVGGSVLSVFRQMSLRVVGVAASPAMAALAMLAPSPLADGTLYSEEDLRNMAVANTNIRLGFNESGQIYGYHVKGAEIPVRHVELRGDKYVVELESGSRLEWLPMVPEDKQGHIFTTPIPDLESYRIWIHPEHGEAELEDINDPYTTPIHEAGAKDYILTFPAESGVPPLYVVYSEDAYSAGFKTTLSSDSYPGVSRARHFQEANENLLQQMEKDPEFAEKMKSLGIYLERTPTGLAPRRPPEGWTWHHEIGEGEMILVPRSQHTIGSEEWGVLHPNNKGGYSIWGK